MTPEEEEAIRREFEAARNGGQESQPAPEEPPSFDLNEYSSIKHVIGVEESHAFPSAFIQTAISGGRRALVFLPEKAD